jgi:hypothetical protein
MSTFNNNFSLLRTIKEVDNALVSAVEEIKLNKDGLALEILNRINDKELLRNELSSELHNTNFELLNTISEGNIRNAVDNERSERNAVINKEIFDRDAAINKEKNYLQLEINKLGFMSTCEAEGILSDNSYPFSYGMGCRSGSRFGLPIPFDYVLRQIGFTCESTDANPSITISIYNYPLSDNFDHPTEDVERSSTPVIDNLTISGKSLSFQQDNILPRTFGGGPGGNLIIKVISTTGLTDENTKMRITLVLTAELPLFINY